MEGVFAIMVMMGAGLVFAAIGVVYSLRRRRALDIEEYVAARGSIGGLSLALTLFASGIGGWVLFSPAEIGATFGVAGMLGYAVGSIVPLLLFVLVGPRLRRLLPGGHALTEWVWHRYGKGTYAATLGITVFYMFLALAAEVTGLALLMELVGGVPLWATALVVLAATLSYTAVGGLRASIFTDAVQSLVIVPGLAALVVLSVTWLGSPAHLVAEAGVRQPSLLRWTDAGGLAQAATLILAIAAAELFNQGNWQRVYAAKSRRALLRGFTWSSALILPVVFVLGGYGIAAVARGQADAPSIALFTVLLGVMPLWAKMGLLVLATTLVMSSIDTMLNALASLAAIDMRRLLPQRSKEWLLQAARWLTVALAVPVWWVAAQGYSVLYLFLVADLVCAAAVIPIFIGLYARRYDGPAALWSMLAGLAAGAPLFPDPAFARGDLLWSFVAAAGASIVASFALRWRAEVFDFGSLDHAAGA